MRRGRLLPTPTALVRCCTGLSAELPGRIVGSARAPVDHVEANGSSRSGVRLIEAQWGMTATEDRHVHITVPPSAVHLCAPDCLDYQVPGSATDDAPDAVAVAT